MLLVTTILALLPAVIFSGQNTPTGWACSPLSDIKASHEDCIGSASYSGGTWSIKTKKVEGQGTDRFCVITLSGSGIKENKDFYVKGTFTSLDPAETRGPFGGISFNMEDADNGNYVMMRLKYTGIQSIEVGSLLNQLKRVAGMSNKNNAAITSGTATLEILVKDGEESVFVDGVLDADMSLIQPFFVEPGAVGFAFQNAKDWGIKISGAEVCSYCVGDNDQTYLIGQSYQDGLKICSCTAAGGMECKCEATLNCGAGTTLWIDPDSCESKCVGYPAYCVSSSDPHYKTFDKKSYSAHGICTYQAATCGDFKVYFKNVNLGRNDITYTKRIELIFLGTKFSIAAGYKAAVNDVPVQYPYTKTYKNGDKVEIEMNGQLEIKLTNKGRDPSVRLRATDHSSSTWINAEMWLHGSCADITEGMCGNWNANPADDIGTGDVNALMEEFKEYDEHCPSPPKPPDQCQITGEGAREEALDICSPLTASPFDQCNSLVPIGDEEEGLWFQCATDICNLFMQKTAACAQFDVYAQLCINEGIDLANWRESVPYCPYICPDGQIYKPEGATPVPTCLNKDPTPTGTVRGCFCLDGQFLQDGVCVPSNQCKCLYEGKFYNITQSIRKDSECEECTCEDAGEMTCEPFTCPGLNCAADELEATEPDECCPTCLSGWVEAVNPNVTVKQGQNVELTCKIKVKGVMKEDIKWYKDREEVTKGISKDRLLLKVSKTKAEDDGTYTCEATKGGVTASDDFTVTVVGPKICEHENGDTWEEGDIYSLSETVECTCDQAGVHVCDCVDDGEECTDPNPVVWFNDECVKICAPDYGLCSAAADPFYDTFDGTQFEFKGDCKYIFFSCGDVKLSADHVKDEASAKTKSIEIAFKVDTYKLEGASVTRNGVQVTVPMHITYGDGAQLTIENLGNGYELKIVHDGKDPMILLKWDKVSSYSVQSHGTCKGFTGGMCGTWDENKNNDLTGPNGDVIKSVEEFGTLWVEDDEKDCPVPLPPTDNCVGIEDTKVHLETYIEEVLGANPFKKCSEKVDMTTFAEEMLQQMCGLKGNYAIACPVLDQLAQKCTAEGEKADNWRTKNKEHKCESWCPDGTTWRTGPKPAPSCNAPQGGRRTQDACFCPDEQVLVDDNCIDVDDCGCEYGGTIFEIGEEFNKGNECKDCICRDKGEDCEDKTCNTKCEDDQLKVVEGECCPSCLSDWVTAVNPEAEGEQGESLALTCEVEGVEITAEEVTWIRNPGNEDITKGKEAYSVSTDGLTLTIKKMDKKRIGAYKCVVEKDGSTSEGNFEVSIPVEEDLIVAINKEVEFTAGENVKAECTLLQPVTEVTWTCNGKKMTAGKGNVEITVKKSITRITFKPAGTEDAGTCTCSAKGIGTEDSDDVKLIGADNELTIKEVENPVECMEKTKKQCRTRWTIEAANGKKVTKKQVKICKFNNGKTSSCKSSKDKKGVFQRKFGKRRKIAHGGEYVAVVTIDGVETISDPVTLNIIENPDETKGNNKAKGDKGDKKRQKIVKIQQ